MGKGNKLMKLLLLILAMSVMDTAKALYSTNDTLEAFTVHKNKVDPVVVFDGINGKVIAKVYPNQVEITGHIFRILESKKGWFRINLNLTHVDAWVKAGALAINSKNYDQAALTFFEKPNTKSKAVYRINFESTLLLMDISDEWLKVQFRNKSGKTYIGWINRDMACGNPYTTCN